MNDNFILLLLIVSCGILIMLIGFFLLFHKSQLKIAEQQRHLQEEKLQHQQALIKASIQSQDMERKRIGKDLHDDIGTHLTILRLSIEQYALSSGRDDERLGKFFHESKAGIDKIISSCRSISHNLSPEIFTLNTLSESIEELCRHFHASNSVMLQADKTVWEVLDRLNEEEAITIYRILEELLTNTAKHAAATQVHISFKLLHERLWVNYRDNGIGIKAARLKHGHGLKHIESRLIALNGDYEHDLQVETGYDMSFFIPLARLPDSSSTN